MTRPSHPGRVVAVVVTYDSEAVVGGLLASLPAAFGGAPYEVVVVDNDSKDATIAAVRRAETPAIVVRNERNLGYAAAVNRVVDRVGPDDALLVLNPDVRLEPGSAQALLDHLGRPGVGITVPLLTAPDGSVAPSLRRRPSVLRALGEALLGGERAGRVAAFGEMVTEASVYQRTGVVDWATGAVMMISGRCLQAVGAWDESYFLFSEETELALRAGAGGYRTLFVPEARAVHIGGASMSSATLYPLLAVNRLRLFRRRHGALASAAFGLALALNDLLRAARPQHRAALAALVWPPARRQVLSGLVHTAATVDLVCFSAQDWWYHNRAHSDFQLMRRIARSHRVLFVNSIGLRMPSSAGSIPPLRRILRKARSVAKVVRRPDPGVPGFVVMTPVILPLYSRPVMRRFNAVLVRAQVRLAAVALGITRPALVVTIPTAVDVVDGMDRHCLIFNRSDKHSAYEEADQALIASMEQRLLRSADHVLYVSRELMAEEAGVVGERGLFLDHGVDLDHFRRTPEEAIPADLRAIPGPRIGFFGGLDDYVVDFALLEYVAKALPDASVVLVGDAGSPMDRLVAVPNLHWLGYRPYESIPSYGSGFDVAIMPWRRNEWIRMCNPIKLKEYLALGLPVVSVDYPEGHTYDGLVRWATDSDGFVEQVRRTLADGGPATPAERRRAVGGASWDDRARRLVELVEGR
ncbi:MAG: glycosyltransferase [Acidimicrobiales bacterium]